MSKEIKVALAQDALSCFAGVPDKVQKKVSEFIAKFMSNPESPGINYETLQGVKDRNLRSVRFGDDYRGIVLKPEAGNVYVLLWIDHHDEAYDWAKRHQCKIHPDTGALQILKVDYQKEIAVPSKPPMEKGLFDGFRDRELRGIGLPEELLPVIRGIKNEPDLDKIVPQLPEEVCDPLFQLASGYSLQEVLNELEVPVHDGKTVDTDDFATALARMHSLRRFVVVESENELQAMLNAPMEKWRVFLHPSQRNLVQKNWSGPVCVLGGAGTGKTVVAIHRAKWLVAKIFSNRSDRILFTTYTKNLADDITNNLRRICSVEQMERIAVINIDKWVNEFVTSQKFGWQIAWDTGRTKHFWDKALLEDGTLGAFDFRFYQEEWEKIILPQGIITREDYFSADRSGRRGRLNRAGRAKIWPVFDSYRTQLENNSLREPEDAMREARLYIQTKGLVFPYRAVIVDEAQDMGMQAFSLIRTIAGDQRENDLFIVGDAHQRIYGKKVVFGRCGINVTGRSKKLRINYRTTEEIRRQAVSIIDNIPVDNLDGGLDDTKAYKSLVHGAGPEAKSFPTFDKECDFVARYLMDEQRKSIGVISVCVVLRTNDLVDRYREAFVQRGVKLLTLKNDSDDTLEDRVGIATMHRVKGLEFDAVVIAGASNKNLGSSFAANEDSTLHEDSSVIERSLLYVAMTRARKEVLVTWNGDMSPLLNNLIVGFRVIT
jgi:hypothetical protein